MTFSQRDVEAAARLIAGSERAIALTGAGISVDSGIPAFRGFCGYGGPQSDRALSESARALSESARASRETSGRETSGRGAQGLWDRYDPMEYAHIDAFLANPERVWEMLRELGAIIEGSEPNAGHRALADLEGMGRLRAVITQNVDGLHQRAGSKEVIEFHGSGQRLVCLAGHGPFQRAVIRADRFPPRCPECGAVLKPDVVLFGEPIPEQAARCAQDHILRTDLVLVVGTTAEVAPAGDIPFAARRRGARVIEVNLEPTHLTGGVANLTLLGSSTEVLPRIVREVEKQAP